MAVIREKAATLYLELFIFVMGEARKSISDLKFMRFSKLNERVQNKYEEMQKKMERAMSVDSLLNGETLVSSGRPRSQIEEAKTVTESSYVNNVTRKEIRRESVITAGMEAESVSFIDNEVFLFEDTSELDDSHFILQSLVIDETSDSSVENNPKLRNRFFSDNISVGTNESRGSSE